MNSSSHELFTHDHRSYSDDKPMNISQIPDNFTGLSGGTLRPRMELNSAHTCCSALIRTPVTPCFWKMKYFENDRPGGVDADTWSRSTRSRLSFAWSRSLTIAESSVTNPHTLMYVWLSLQMDRLHFVANDHDSLMKLLISHQRVRFRVVRKQEDSWEDISEMSINMHSNVWKK
jgi:hypothetical protein